MGVNIGIYIRKIDSEDGRWMELPQGRVRWQTLVLAVWNLQILLEDSQLRH